MISPLRTGWTARLEGFTGKPAKPSFALFGVLDNAQYRTCTPPQPIKPTLVRDESELYVIDFEIAAEGEETVDSDDFRDDGCPYLR